jgi:ATP/maltotriose-dependent transcriptional regulator MalT
MRTGPRSVEEGRPDAGGEGPGADGARRLGLDDTAEATYRALLAGCQPTAGTLAEHVGRPLEAVEEALDCLAELSLVQSWRQARTVRLVSPTRAVGALLARQQAELALRQGEYEQLQDTLLLLLREYESRPGRTEPLCDLHLGLQAQRRRMRELALGVEREWLWVVNSTPPFATPSEAQWLDECLLLRGRTVRALYSEGLRKSHAPARSHSNWQALAGVEVRIVAAALPGMVVIDRRTAVVPLDTAGRGMGAVEVRDRGLTEVAGAFVEMAWDRARPFAVASEPIAGDLSDHERAVLRLLANGLTDDSVAAKLGVSARTVSRTVAALMGRLGVRSRFQAGHRAEQLGWLD